MYYQDDKDWSRLRWYDSNLDSAFSAITDVVHAADRVDIGEDGSPSTLGCSGCWHVSIASMLAHFNEHLYGSLVTPRSLLRSLRERKLGSLTGYVEYPFVDPISIITDTKVQLHRFRDFGKNGVSQSSAAAIDILKETQNENICAIVNVSSHEFFGKSDSHYVLAYRPDGSDYCMHDPSSKRDKYLSDYKKIFQVTLYVST